MQRPCDGLNIKRVWASLKASKEAFINDVRDEMYRRDPKNICVHVIVTDGERALQLCVNHAISDAMLILDLFHALEKLLAVAHALHSYDLNGVAPIKTGIELWMEESHEKGLASHLDPEPCAGGREAVGEALARESAGEVLSFERVIIWGADVIPTTEGNTEGSDKASSPPAPRSLRPSSCVDTL